MKRTVKTESRNEVRTMKITELVKKLKLYGLKGIVDFLKGRLWERKWHGYFSQNASRWHDESKRGITIVTKLSSQGSVYKVMRDLCFSLRDAGIPFQTLDLGEHEIPPEDMVSIVTPKSDFFITKYASLVEMLSSPVQDGLVRQRGRIVFWEFEDGVLDAYPNLINREGDIIAMSDFIYENLKKELNGKRRVYKVLYPLRLDVERVSQKAECRRKFGLEEKDFVVFYNFSYGSGWNRKNAVGALEAFAKAFRNMPEAKLVFKTAARKTHEDRARQLADHAEELGVSKQVVFVDDYMTQIDVYNLTNACDVYLSLHRSEGLGLGIAEAMILGKAVVVTGYSAPLEFCNERNSMLIPYKMIPVDCSDVPWYSSAKVWADADVNAASKALRKLYDNPTLRNELGAKAKAFVEDHFAIANFKRDINAYLDYACR